MNDDNLIKLATVFSSELSHDHWNLIALEWLPSHDDTDSEKKSMMISAVNVDGCGSTGRVLLASPLPASSSLNKECIDSALHYERTLSSSLVVGTGLKFNLCSLKAAQSGLGLAMRPSARSTRFIALQSGRKRA